MFSLLPSEQWILPRRATPDEKVTTTRRVYLSIFPCILFTSSNHMIFLVQFGFCYCYCYWPSLLHCPSKQNNNLFLPLGLFLRRPRFRHFLDHRHNQVQTFLKRFHHLKLIKYKIQKLVTDRLRFVPSGSFMSQNCHAAVIWVVEQSIF